MKSLQDILASDIPEAPVYEKPQRYCIVCNQPIRWIPETCFVKESKPPHAYRKFYSRTYIRFHRQNMDGSEHQHLSVEIDRARRAYRQKNYE